MKEEIERFNNENNYIIEKDPKSFSGFFHMKEKSTGNIVAFLTPKWEQTLHSIDCHGKLDAHIASAIKELPQPAKEKY